MTKSTNPRERAGDNSDPPANVNTKAAKEKLKAIIERIEKLEDERALTSEDIRDVYAEAKGNGFDGKALRTIIKLRKQDAAERREQQELVDTYAHALGMAGVFG